MHKIILMRIFGIMLVFGIILASCDTGGGYSGGSSSGGSSSGGSSSGGSSSGGSSSGGSTSGGSTSGGSTSGGSTSGGSTSGGSTSGGSTSGGSTSVPAAPYLELVFTPGDTLLAWTAVSGATRYYIYYGTSTNTNYMTMLTSTTSISYNHKTTKVYYYAVRAWNTYGYSNYSNVVSTY